MTKVLFIQAMMAYMNIPYIYGGKTPLVGIDCSGLAEEAMRMVGLDPPGVQNAQAYYDHFIKDGTNGVMDTGSLVFYGDAGRVTHVAIMLDSSGTIIEAGGGDAKTIDVITAQGKNAKVRVRPYNHRKDIVAVVKPKGLVLL